MASLFKRGEIWWASFRDERGTRHRVSTAQRNRTLARTAARQLERDHLESGSRPAPLSVIDSLAMNLAGLERRGRAEGTIDFTRKKAKHLARLLGTVDVNDLTLRRVEQYCDARRAEGASKATIGKELGVLRQSLRRAAKYKVSGRPVFRGSADELIPEGIIGSYTPRDRALTREEYARLRAALPEKRRIYLDAFLSIATRDSELYRIRVCDLHLVPPGTIRLPGKKTLASDTYLPLSDDLRVALAEHVRGMPADASVFPWWKNVRRDLAYHCARIGIPRVSPNDLRRTFATWLAEAGVPEAVTASLLRHASSAMVRRVYVKVGVAAQQDAVAKLPRIGPPDTSPTPASASGTVSLIVTGPTGWDGRDDTSNPPETQPKPNVSAPRGRRDTRDPLERPDGTEKPRASGASAVPRDRIELPTRGFSIPCSTN
jgi:integrase